MCTAFRYMQECVIDGLWWCAALRWQPVSPVAPLPTGLSPGHLPATCPWPAPDLPCTSMLSATAAPCSARLAHLHIAAPAAALICLVDHTQLTDCLCQPYQLHVTHLVKQGQVRCSHVHAMRVLTAVGVLHDAPHYTGMLGLCYAGTFDMVPAPLGDSLGLYYQLKGASLNHIGAGSFVTVS